MAVTSVASSAGEQLSVSAQGPLRAEGFLETQVSSTAGNVRIRSSGVGNDVSFLNTNNITSAIPFIESTVRASNGDVFLNLRSIAFPNAVSNAGQDSFAVCICGPNTAFSNTLYLVQGNATCSDTATQYLTNPCL